MQDKKVISYGLKEATSQHTELNKSSIFEITVPYEFALGMNEVKLNLTSRYLRQGTDILIDVNDPSGNPLYYEISPIANSDNSRSIVVHISDTVLPGKAQIILYCVLINGETYKCIIERNILVKETSTSDVKFSEPPKVIYSEKLLPVQLMTSTSRLVDKTFSGASISTIGGIVPKQLVFDALTVEVRELAKAEPANTVTNGVGTSSIQEVPNKINYSVLTGKGFAFSSSMVGGTIIVNNIVLEAPKDAVNTSLFQNQKYSASILNVINTSSIEIFPPFFKKIDYTNSAGEQKVQSFDRFFNHGNFTASYYETITLAEASVTQSYAVLDILNLNNTSGKIAGIDVSYKPIGNLGSNFKSLGVFDVQANNLLVDKTNVYFDSKLGIIERPIGLFKNGISDFYTYWTATGNQPVTLSASTRVSDGVLLTFPPAYTGSSDNVIIRPKDTYLFLAGKNSDFQFDIQVFSEQVFQKSPQIDVYISGSDVVGTSIIDDVEYEPIFSSSFGKYIGSFGPKVRSGQLTFTNKKEGYILPVFVLRYANWHIGDIEIKPLTKEGFNPSQTKIIASTELITGSELTIQLDYLDAKGKKSKFSTIIDKVYFKGSTVPVSVSGSGGGGGPTPVLPTGLISGSDQLTSSYDARYERTGRGIISSSNQVKALLPTDLISSSEQVAYNKIAGVPANIISSSLQFSSYLAPFTGSFTGSFKGDGSGLYNLPISSSSIPLGTVSGSNQLTSSYDVRYELRGNNIVSSSAQVKAFLPIGSVSGSNQLTSSYDTRYERKGTNIFSSSAQVVYSSVTGIPTGLITGSNQLTSSYDTRYERKGTNIFSSSAQVTFSGITGVPSTLVTGSNQLTSSYDTRYEIRGNNIVSSSVQVKSFLPIGSVSGSDQATSSYDIRYERKGTNIFSSSAQVVYSSITGIPTNLVTGSNQLTSSYDTRYEIRGNNIVSSSGQVKTLLPNDLVSSSAQISYTGISNVPANIVSGSNQLTSSYDTRYELRGSNIISSSGQFTSFSSPFTGSFTGSFFGSFSGDGSALYNIPMVSGSVPAGTVTGSDQLTSSYDTRYERKGTNIFSSSAQVIYGSITGIPTGLVTGSNQLTSSYDTRYELRGNNIVSSSVQVKAFLPAASVSGSNQLTSSYDTRYERKGTNIFSSSAQVVYSSITGIPSNLLSGSDQSTSSYDTRYERKGTNIFSSSAQVIYSSITGTPANLVSGSNQLTSSYDVRYEVRGNNIVSSSVQVKAFLPANTISGSDQATSSYDTRYERKGTNIFSSSAQVVYSGIAGIPTNLVSGSNQLTSSYDTRYEIRGSNIVSSSAQVISAFPTGVVSGSNQLTSSYDTRYEIRGSNIISSSDQLTSSYDVRYERKGTDIVSSSAQVKNLLPANTVSSSLQFSNLSSPFTGSFTGSFNGLFTGDGSGLYNIPLVSGSVPNGTVTGSDQLTSSYDTRYERKGTNIFSSSVQVIYSSITGIPVGLITGSNQLTSSYDVRYETRGNNIVSSSAQVKSFLPVGSISGSDQLTSSYDTKYEVRGNNIVSSSVQIKALLPLNSVSGSDQLTSSYDVRFERKGTNIFSSSAQVVYSSITGIPSGIITGSNQLTGSYDTRYEIRGNNIVSSSVQVKAFLPIGSVSGSDQLTSSYDVRFERKGTNIFSSSAQVLSVLPAGTVTGSNQLTSSYDTRYEIRGNNIISSSAQIKSLLPAASVSGSDQLTSSYDTRYETRGSSIVSSSAQVKNFLPANTVSSSAQFTNTSSPFTGSFTGSFAGDGSGLTNLPITPGTVPPGTVSSSLQFNSTTFPFTGSFNGNFEGSGSGLTNIPGTAITPGYFALLTSNIFSGSQEIQGSGSKIFSVQGSVGELFAVFDGLSGSLFAVKNISGLPIFEVFSDNQVKIGQYGSEPIKISGSQAIVTGSFSGDGSGLTNLPTSTLPPNLVSGSNQLTSSYDARYERKGTNIFSSSAQVTFSGIIGTPSGLVSGSNQLTSSYDTRYERKGTNIFSSSAQVNYNDVINKPIITLPQSDRLLSSDGTVSGSRANDGLQYVSSSKWTKLLLRTNVIQEQTYSSSFWSSQWTFVSQSTFVATPANRNFSVYVPAGFNNDTNAPITSSTFHSSYAIEVENHIYGVTGSMSNPLNAYNWNSTTQFRAYYNPANLALSPLISGYSAQSSSVYNGMGGYGGAYTGRPDLNAWYSVTGVSYAGDGLFKVDLTLGPSSSFGWTLYIATTAKVIKHEIRV